MKQKIKSVRKKIRQRELIAIIQRILEKMENNPAFTSPPAALAMLRTVLPELETALINAAGRDKEMVSIKNDKKDIALNLLEEIAEYVMKTSKGDRTMLLSSGFEITGEVINTVVAPTIEKLEVELGAPGEATTRVRNVKAAISYIHEYTTEVPGPNTVWNYQGTSQGFYRFDGLSSDKRYWFRVVVIGRNGLRTYSPVVTRVIQ